MLAGVLAESAASELQTVRFLCFAITDNVVAADHSNGS